MPNWCDNRATVTGPAPTISKIKEILLSEDPELLSWMVPEPKFEGDQDWYSWRINSWGTKWPLSDVYIDEDDEPDSITFTFSTAWSPPIEAFHTWAVNEGNVQFSLDYWEPGIGFVGTTSYDGEYLDDEVYDFTQHHEEYVHKAGEDWGYEEQPEPEPLTEWYKQGVEDKGLE